MSETAVATKKFYTVEVLRTISCQVVVEAESPRAAYEIVNDRSFELPRFEDHEILDSWEFVILEDGNEALRID